MGWYWWSDRSRSERLILIWPAAARAEASLQIDGRTFDLVRDPVVGGVEELEFALPRGSHHVQIVRPGYEPIDESIELTGGTPARLAVTFVSCFFHQAWQTRCARRPRLPSVELCCGGLLLRVRAPACEIDGRTR